MVENSISGTMNSVSKRKQSISGASGVAKTTGNRRHQLLTSAGNTLDNEFKKQEANTSIASGTQPYLIGKPINSSTLTQQQLNAEFSILLKHLIHEPNDTQVEIIHSIRRLLKHHVFPSSKLYLPESSKQVIFQTFYQFLTETSDQYSTKYLHRVLAECTMLIVEMIPNVPIESLEKPEYLPSVLPYIVPNLGHEAIEVRRATLRLLHVYMRYTLNLNELIELYIRYGLRSKQKNAQKGCILSLPLLFTQEFFNNQDNIESGSIDALNSDLNLFPLLQCLSDLLVHADARLFYAIYLAIQRLHTLLGNRVFKLYLQRVDQEAVLLYHKVLSRNTSTASSNNVFDSEPLTTNQVLNGVQLIGNGNVDRLVMDDIDHHAVIRKASVARPQNNTDAEQASGEESILSTINSKTDANNKSQVPINNDEPIPLQQLITRGELPKFDKYDKLMLDQLVSNEEEVRKQSFEILSSPTSLINEDDEDEQTSAVNTLYRSGLTFEEEKMLFFKKKQLKQAEQETNRAINELSFSPDKSLNMTDNWTSNENKKMDINFGYLREEIATNDLKTSNRPHNPLNNELDNLLFGLIPENIVHKALSSKLLLKNEAMNQILNIIKQATCTQLTMLTLNDNLNDFFTLFLVKLIDHPNFKVTLQALEIVDHLVSRLKNQLIKCLPTLINILIKRLGDSRVVVRQQAIQTIHLLTLKLPTQPVLDALITHLSNRNPRVRAEVVNRITVILLVIPRDQFNLCALCYDLSSLLVDDKRIVRLAVLECMAVLGQCLGAERMRKLVRCAEAIERVQNSTGLVTAVKARLARRDLPRVLADASVRYVLNPNGFSGWYPNLADADIDWILQGSTSATSTPPKFSLKTPVNYCASYQDLTSVGNPCGMKRGSCVMVDNGQNQSSNYQAYSDNGFDSYKEMLIDFARPINTGSRPSESTVDIERLIEKNTTDQLKSRELSTGESQYSIQSEQSVGQASDDSRELWRYYYQKFKQQISDVNCTNSELDKKNKNDNMEKSRLTKQNSSEEREFGDDDIQQNINLGNTSEDEFKNITNNKFRHTKTMSMPMISCAQLSDISEQTEFTTSCFNPKEDNRKDNLISPSPDSLIKNQRCNQESRNENLRKNQEEFEEQQRRNQHQFEQASKNTESEEDGKYESDAIEIKVQQASTISDESKPPTLPDTNQLGSDLKLRKKSNVSINQADIILNNEQKPNETLNTAAKTNNTDKKELNDNNEYEEQNENKKNFESNPDNSRSSSADSIGSTATLVPENNQKLNQNQNLEQKSENQNSTEQNERDNSGFNNQINCSKSNKYYKPMIPVKRRESRSTSPQKRKSLQQNYILSNNEANSITTHQQLIRIQPAIPSNANIRNILENVTKTEGPFKEPDEALKAAIAAFTQDSWTTKVEGMLAVTRLATFHANVLKKELHTVVLALAYEVKNLRSTVSRSAIFTLGDLLVKMKGSIDFEMDVVAQALLQKCGENIQFIKEDIEKALTNFITYMPPVRAALAIINHGSMHRNVLVRRISAHYLATLIENMGPTKALLGPRDLAENLLPTTAALLLDKDPQARYSARRIFNVLINHAQFNSLLSKHVQPAAYRTIIGTLQSIKRRGVGEKPAEASSK